MKPAPVGNTKDFDPTPAGNHVARLYQVINIGTIPTTWQGEDRMTHKIRLTFELCNERKVSKEGEQERPYVISREFTYTMAEKGNLRPFIEGFIGTSLTDDEAGAFKVWDLLGKECMLNVVHDHKDGKTYANIKSVATLPKGMTAPEIFNEPKLIDVETITNEELDALPEFIRVKMKSSEEWNARLTTEEIHENSPF